MGSRVQWGKDADRRWRKTFTRENKEGDAKLRHAFRHGRTPEQIARGLKAEHLAREAAEDRQVEANTYAALRDARMTGAGYDDSVYVSRGTRIRLQSAVKEFIKASIRKMLCRLGRHELQDRHKMLLGHNYGMETGCRHCPYVK